MKNKQRKWTDGSLSDKECLGGNDGHKLTKQDVRDGYHLCKSCRARNASFAPNAEGISVGIISWREFK
ncbi:hypothetical protein JW977_00525 [Candidatus Falkowbacteria bacterium]|nr:hypothetical protein [Candidatus Falkowbacteria bacterium]